MSKSNPLLIEPFYLPPISWFIAVKSEPVIYFDVKKNYEKGNYFNRCEISGPNGRLLLSIPLQHGKHQQRALEEIKTAQSMPWQKIHWQTICSCYRRSVYFEYYEEMFYPFYHTGYETLTGFTVELLKLIFSILKWDKEINFTDKYIEPATGIFQDMRKIISPKKPNIFQSQIPVYTQVFADRFPYIRDLSVIDLLFNQKPEL